MTEPRIIRERYRLERPLQLGPLATTYLAHDLQDGEDERPVVLKQLALHPSIPRGDGAERASELLARYKLLEREAKILRNLEHPGIPSFIDTFHEEDESGRTSIWLVQEFREGRTLRDMIEDGWHGSADDIADILCKVAEILAYLHSRVPPIVHRDVKPANIIVGPDGAVSLVDLGAACTRVLEDRRGSTIVGTPGYVPMEQFVGQAVPASDVYALGMVGVFLVTHEEPLSLIREDGTVQYKHLAMLEHPTLLPTIDRMIAPTVEQRPKNAMVVLERLRAEEPVDVAVDQGAGQDADADRDADPETQGRDRAETRAWLRPLAYAAGMLLLLGGAVGGTYAYMVGQRADHAEDTARTGYEALFGDLHEVSEEALPDEDAPSPMDGLEVPEPAVPAEPVCDLVRVGADGDPDSDTEVPCEFISSAVPPMVVEPGRIRFVTHDVPEEAADRELAMPRWLEETGSIYWVVDVTLDGREVLGATGCPDASEPAAASLDRSGRVHLACLDYDNQAHVVVFDTERKNAWVRGSYALDQDVELLDHIGYSDMSEDMGLRLAVPQRGPALLVYPSYDDVDEREKNVYVQPLARGSKSFALFPRELSEVGEWVIYNQDGQVYALVRARRQGEDVRRLHKVAITALGSRISGTVSLEQSTGDVFCHRITTAEAGGSLLIRSPNDFGDQTMQATIAGAYAIPGPDTASAHTDVCANSTGVFVKVGEAETRFLHPSTSGGHKLGCVGERCIMAYYDYTFDTVVTRFTLP